ncbi:MAG: YqaA family protein [Pseudomonadota bacterium]
MLRATYDWCYKQAQSKFAVPVLGFVSFIESSVFPIPPDVLLIPMVIANRAKWFWYGFVCTVASVAGALAGYFIGMFLYEAVAEPVLAFYGKADRFGQISEWYNTYGGWGVLFAAVTPFPYKVLTIFSGATGLNLVTFVVVSIIGRGLRFFLIAALLARFGAPIEAFIEKRLGLLFTIFVVLLVGGFLAVRYMF